MPEERKDNMEKTLKEMKIEKTRMQDSIFDLVMELDGVIGLVKGLRVPMEEEVNGMTLSKNSLCNALYGVEKHLSRLSKDFVEIGK